MRIILGVMDPDLKKSLFHLGMAGASGLVAHNGLKWGSEAHKNYGIPDSHLSEGEALSNQKEGRVHDVLSGTNIGLGAANTGLGAVHMARYLKKRRQAKRDARKEG